MSPFAWLHKSDIRDKPAQNKCLSKATQCTRLCMYACIRQRHPACTCAQAHRMVKYLVPETARDCTMPKRNFCAGYADGGDSRRDRKLIATLERSKSPGTSNWDLMRAELGSLFLRNRLSCTDIHKLCLAAHGEGIASIAELAAAGNWGKQRKNLSRDFFRHYMKSCDAPALYMAEIPTWNLAEDKQEVSKIAFLPIPDMIRMIIEKDSGFKEKLGVPAHMPELVSLLREAAKQQGIDDTPGALGLHADGVPYLKNDSLEIFSWNMPGHPHLPRVPITAIPKRYVCKCSCKGWCTINAVVQVCGPLSTHQRIKEDGHT